MSTAASGAASRFLAIGRIVAPHGIRGEVKVELLTDYPERYRPGARVYRGTAEEASPDEIASARQHHQHLLVRLKSVPDRTQAERLRGQYLLIPEAEAMPLGEHENYAHDLIGVQVITVEGRGLGTLSEILATAANDVYVVRDDERELLIPALREVVLRVDLVAKTMVVALPEGLEDTAGHSRNGP